MNMSNRSVVMDTCRIEKTGDAERIYNDPRARFVADFVGLINTLNAKITTSDVDVGAETPVVVQARPQDTPNEVAPVSTSDGKRKIPGY